MDIKEKLKAIQGKKIAIGALVAGLIATVILYVLLIKTQENALAAYEKGVIFVATQSIPKGTEIKEDNYARYFVQKELAKTVIPKSAVTDPAQLTGLITSNVIDDGTLITAGMFDSINQITKDMKEPVIAGFKVDDLYQAVGGTLRTGDSIHIYNLNAEGVAELMWSDVYIQQVFDNTGVTITSDNTTTAAQRVNVYMDKKDVEMFYSNLSAGTLRVVKACD